jgi:TrmH family RNA methyltransferase
MTTQIASPQNPRLKALRRLQSRREDLIAAAQRAGVQALEGYRLAGSGLGDDDFFDVERSALGAVSTLGSGTRVIGVYEQHWGTPAGPLCVYLHGVGDPGNVGTVLRSAQAFGASCVALGPGCADPHSPKAVRASMGAIFAVALARVDDVARLPGERVALIAGAAETLRGPGADERSRGFGKRGAEESSRGSGKRGAEEPSRGSGKHGASPVVTLLVGAERDGLPEDVVAACERSARIPIASESLNAAMAATVALYEMTRGTLLAGPARGGRACGNQGTVPA